ncbi:PREDICTED: BTB/POZ domain-containing protein FBL11 isoform X2 [Tarenaya hassleriana]|uniref:BTB/POZ domain-containing protein FBL11 isoform X2 n=1 Tax=Tarenaya hassleriana TaxID=28532 RepID=UPI00053C2A47|nr:PREDICTED: BTB/POZ domain-containing protein FBL11 isoform X2 [Tarenaya hassleriana]
MEFRPGACQRLCARFMCGLSCKEFCTCLISISSGIWMLLKSNKFFGNVPYELLMHCIKHPHLTVDSEMHLADGLLVWLDANRRNLESSTSIQNDLIILMEQVHYSLLPLWFTAGKRKSHIFSKYADQSIDLVIRLMKMSSIRLVDMLGDSCPADLRVRLSEYSERLDLSGCPHMNAAIMVLSVLPNSYYINTVWKKSLKTFLMNLEDGERNRFQSYQRSLPILSFERVQEVDISKCPSLDVKSVIECLSKSFPSLTKLRAAYLLNFKMTTLCKVLQKFPQLREVDLTVDITPVILGQASVVYSSPASIQTASNLYMIGGINSINSGQDNCSVSYITRLTLEGRSDICDTELQSISRLCDSLQYLNIKGCVLVSDACIADIIQRCTRLQSIIVCYTSFAGNSVRALCTSISTLKEPMNSIATNLRMLHMSGCKGVNEALLTNLISQTHKLKSLCLKDTEVTDTVLCKFSGCSLEMLDISNTMVSRPALAHVISKNYGLKCLKARGCKTLLQVDSDRNSADFFFSWFGQELVNGLDKRCGLEELEMGWGFSYSSFESMRPAITFLRSISLGLGGSLGEHSLKLLPSACPLLESVIFYFQDISDSALTNIMTSLKHLQELALCYCFGDISMLGFKFPIPNLRKLRLERVTRWMTSDDLFVLTQSCPNLIELSLVGCVLLNSGCQTIISTGWPGMISLHLEDCGGITEKGVSSFFDCVALEDLLLRHNGSGIERNFILNAASKLPMLRIISLDMCDARDSDFDVPEEKNGCYLRIVKIARCKSKRCAFGIGAPMHKETMVMVWNSKDLTKTLVKERL